eukprot:185908-Pyramimonas_sp.AAC.1
MPRFEVHSLSAYTEPSEDISASTSPTDHARIATKWIEYIVNLQEDLKKPGVSGVTGTLRPEHITYFDNIYAHQVMMYFSYINTTPRTATTAHPGIPSLRAPANIKATMPDKYTGSHEKLDLYLNNMQAYFDVTNTPADKQPGVLRSNISDTVLQVLTNTYNTPPAFWSDKDQIIAALKKLYTQPNKAGSAQVKFRALKMLHFNLSKYYSTFITLCGESGYNPDDQHVKTSFHQGLNNLSTRGGLRTQIIEHLYDPTKTVQDLYLLCDHLLSTEHGTNYNNKTCAKDSNEHGAAAGQASSSGVKNTSGWTSVQKKRKTNNSSNNNGYNNTTRAAKSNKNKDKGKEKATTQEPVNEGPKCFRCKNFGHKASECNAQWNKETKQEIPIETAALFKDGTWKKGDSHPKVPTTESALPSKAYYNALQGIVTCPTILEEECPTILEEDTQVLEGEILPFGNVTVKPISGLASATFSIQQEMRDAAEMELNDGAQQHQQQAEDEDMNLDELD